MNQKRKEAERKFAEEFKSYKIRKKLKKKTDCSNSFWKDKTMSGNNHGIPENIIHLTEIS